MEFSVDFLEYKKVDRYDKTVLSILKGTFEELAESIKSHNKGVDIAGSAQDEKDARKDASVMRRDMSQISGLYALRGIPVLSWHCSPHPGSI